MQMPVLDGYGATGKLREAGYKGPIIALTAHAMNSDREKCLNAGCDNYATKPIDKKKLISLVSHYVQQRTFAEVPNVCRRNVDCDQSGTENTPVAPLCRVLLAEDTRCMQHLIGRLCERAGASVVYVDDGAVAYETAIQAQVDAEPFDIVLMDMQMPICDGYSATRRLRRDGYESPIIALTANAQEGDREKCIAAGCDDYVTKPIDRNVLNSLLQQYSPVTSG